MNEITFAAGSVPELLYFAQALMGRDWFYMEG